MDPPPKNKYKLLKFIKIIVDGIVLLFGVIYFVPDGTKQNLLKFSFIKQEVKVNSALPQKIVTVISLNAPELGMSNSSDTKVPFYLPLQEISRPTISPYIAPAAHKILDSLVFYDQKMQISISDALAMALKPKHDKNYHNLSALEKSKKQFLLNAAKVIYMENSENLIPNSILIAIAVHESAWGNSRFYKDGNNYFNLVAEKNEDFIKALRSNQKVAKYRNKEESVRKFLSWISNKKHYQIVRDTLLKYKKGISNKDEIIDSIASTGFSTDQKWAKNVKFTHKNRIDGKNKDELKALFIKLYANQLSLE